MAVATKRVKKGSSGCRLGASTVSSTMKITTYNINNVNKRLRNLVAWLENAKPDVVCLQELKATGSESP